MLNIGGGLQTIDMYFLTFSDWNRSLVWNPQCWQPFFRSRIVAAFRILHSDNTEIKLLHLSRMLWNEVKRDPYPMIGRCHWPRWSLLMSLQRIYFTQNTDSHPSAYDKLNYSKETSVFVMGRNQKWGKIQDPLHEILFQTNISTVLLKQSCWDGRKTSTQFISFCYHMSPF